MKTKLMLAVLVLNGAFFACTTAGGTSLWAKREHSASNMYADSRARQIGDIITIIISEAVKTERDSNIKTAKKETILNRITSVFFPSTSSNMGKHNGSLPIMDRNTNNSFDGGGTVDNEDTFEGKITAQVIEVYPNGNLLVQGNKEIQIVDEQQVVTVSGIVRPQDIGTDNQVASYMMADVRINYEGKGAIRDNQKRSIFTRFWDKVNLF